MAPYEWPLFIQEKHNSRDVVLAWAKHYLGNDIELIVERGQYWIVADQPPGRMVGEGIRLGVAQTGRLPLDLQDILREHLTAEAESPLNMSQDDSELIEHLERLTLSAQSRASTQNELYTNNTSMNEMPSAPHWPTWSSSETSSHQYDAPALHQRYLELNNLANSSFALADIGDFTGSSWQPALGPSASLIEPVVAHSTTSIARLRDRPTSSSHPGETARTRDAEFGRSPSQSRDVGVPRVSHGGSAASPAHNVQRQHWHIAGCDQPSRFWRREAQELDYPVPAVRDGSLAEGAKSHRLAGLRMSVSRTPSSRTLDHLGSQHVPPPLVSQACDRLLKRAKTLQDRTFILLRILRLSYRAAQSAGGSNNSLNANDTSCSAHNGEASSKRKSDGGTSLNVSLGRDDGGGDQEDEPNAKRPRAYTQDDSNCTAKRLPCPFKVKEPRRFAAHKPYSYMSKLQTHLQVNHKTFVCTRCLIQLDSRQALATHKHDKACDSGACARHLPRGIECIEQCECLTAEKQWTGLYHLLFPQDTVPEVFAQSVPDFPRLPHELPTRPVAGHGTEIVTDVSESARLIEEVMSMDGAAQHPEFWEPSVDTCSDSLGKGSGTSQLDIYAAQIRQLQNANVQILEELRSASQYQFRLAFLEAKTKEMAKKIEAAEKSAVNDDLVRVVLGLVWEKLQASGHPEANAGGKLGRLVAMLTENSVQHADTTVPPCDIVVQQDLPRIDSAITDSMLFNSELSDLDFDFCLSGNSAD